MNYSSIQYINRNQLIKKQSGAAFLILISSIVFIIIIFVIGKISVNKQLILRHSNTIDTLRISQDALLGYALSQSTPGLLPCPDTTGNGDQNMSGSDCTSTIGWLPSRTLGLNNVTDASGTKILYAVESRYTKAITPFNSSIIPTLTNDGELSAFIVLAANKTLNNQVRSNTTISSSLLYNFFEGINADGNLDTFKYQRNDNNNDQLLSISTQSFWTLIEEKIVLPASIDYLENYRSTCSAYPWAAPFNSNFNGNNLDSTINLLQGSLPLDNSIPSDNSTCTTTINYPAWLKTHWANYLQYSSCLNSSPQCLTINGDTSSSANAIVVAPGIPLTSQIRPSNNLDQYFENDNQLINTQFLFLESKNHHGNFNDTLMFLP